MIILINTIMFINTNHTNKHMHANDNRNLRLHGVVADVAAGAAQPIVAEVVGRAS